jgi:HNH endonuclease
MAISAANRRAIRERAGHRCEYCHIEQAAFPFAQFHIEHIIAKQHGGGEDLSNFCLACHWCNCFKGPNIATLVDGALVPLFHPRLDGWFDHFDIRIDEIVGKTTLGIGTVALLNMNDDDRRRIRATGG